MGSTFGGFEISKRGLQTHQKALEVTGHNVANADNKSYARQRVLQTTIEPLYEPGLTRAQGAGQIGQGVKVAAIERVRDLYYDDQILNSTGSQSYWENRNSYLSQVENILKEPGGESLRTIYDRFWQDWQTLSQFPAEPGHRQVVLETGQTLAERVQSTFSMIQDLRQQADREILFTVKEVNTMATEIRALNEKILKIQTLGENPNDLMDRRDNILEQLGKLVNVRVGRSDKDELIVFIGEQALVQGEVQRFLEAVPNTTDSGLHQIVWQHSEQSLVLESGSSKLRGLLEIRDRDLVQSLNDTDTIALNLADIVNQIHRDGFGVSQRTDLNFFALNDRNGQSIYGNFAFSPTNPGGANLAVADVDLDADGITDHTGVFRVTGSNQIKENEMEIPLGLAGQLTFQRANTDSTEVLISYEGTDSLADIIERINDAQIGVVAYVDHVGRMSLKATASQWNSERTAAEARNRNFMIRHLEDSGDLLVGRLGILQASGAGGAFDYRNLGALAQLNIAGFIGDSIALTPLQNTAAHLKVSVDVSGNPSNVATAFGRDKDGNNNPELANNAGDGGVALAIAIAMKEKNRMVGQENTFLDFYANVIGEIGSRGKIANDNVQRYKDVMVFLQNQRQSVMGVNLDEEMSNMVQFQHSYNASARMLRAFDEMYDMIINGIGGLV